jgi:hypothetical protein
MNGILPVSYRPVTIFHRAILNLIIPPRIDTTIIEILLVEQIT